VTDPDALPQSQGVDPAPLADLTAEVREKPLFRTIFEGEFAYVAHTLRRLGVAERDLDDVTHDVFVAVYRCLHQYDAARPLRPWLFGTAFRVASDHRRLARNHREVLGDPTEPIDESPGADQQLASHESRELVLLALGALDLDRRAVLVMHDIDGHTMPEIAEGLSIPLNTAYSRLRLAREQFKAAVRRLRGRRGES
jgi:RNA polymerase sigma-70 factor, ECF subfamily